MSWLYIDTKNKMGVVNSNQETRPEKPYSKRYFRSNVVINRLLVEIKIALDII